MLIKKVKAKEILDSRGNPTIEVEIITDNGLFKASVPSGKSTGKYEAVELRDGGRRYQGQGVLKAVNKINTIINKSLTGMTCENQKDIDNKLIQLDGTKNKRVLGANAILSVSMGVCRAGASAKKLKLYNYISQLSGNSKINLPVPSFNMINGGVHSNNKLSIQEFMILPLGARNFKDAMKIGGEIFQNLKKIIKEKYGRVINMGDEGGFSPNISDNEEAIKLLENVIKKLGYSKKVKIGIDVAASEFFNKGKYDLNFKGDGDKLRSSEEMIKLYKNFVDKYDVMSIEDPFDQDDIKNWKKLTSFFKNKVQIVGDDLLVTNPGRIKKAIKEKFCNSLLLKINQIGTISEAIESANLAKKAGWKVIVSHRSGETKDNFIADLAVGLGCGQIKAGAPNKIERLAKYNRLLKIENELGNEANYG